MKNFFNKFTQDDDLSVNITSMIDVIFILLVFFMVSTQFKKSSLPVNLPQSEDQTQPSENSRLKTLTVTESEICLEGKSVNLNELTDILKQAFDLDTEVQVSLECEKTVSFQRVVEVFTKIQKAGIAQIGIVHEQQE